MQIGFLIAALLVGVIALAVALQVDDWSRDLTSNTAQTSEGADDPDLRPLATSTTGAKLAADVKRAAESLPGWSVVAVDTGQLEVVVRLVRTTKLFRFKDDITVRIVDQGPQRLLTVTSRSRVGKGDLGQNPRNIKELLGAIRSQIEGENDTHRMQDFVPEGRS